VEVNLARQVICYVRNGKIQRIIDSSTGSGAWYYSQGRRARAITPTGRFGIYWRYNGGSPGRSARCTARTISTAVTPCTG
jgi:cell wall hydrolase